MAPPGGASSISFGSDPTPPSRMNGNKKNEGSDIFGNGDAEASPQKPKSQRNSSNIFGVDEDTPSACPPKQSQSAPTRQDEDDGNRPAGRSNPQGGTYPPNNI